MTLSSRASEPLPGSPSAGMIAHPAARSGALVDSERALAAEVTAMNRLQELSIRLLAAADLPTVFTEVLDAAMDLLGADLGMTQVYDPATHSLELVGHRGFTDEFPDDFKTVTVGDATSCALALERVERVIVEDTLCDPRLEKNWPALLDAGIRAVTTVPIVSRGGAILGMVSTQFRQPHRPSERELHILDLYIRQATEIIERGQAEEALRASETRYRTLFQSMDEGFCVIERVEPVLDKPLDFRYVEANPAFGVQSGVSDVVGQTIRQAFPGEPEEWFETYDEVLRTGEPIRFERGLVTQGRVLELYAFRMEDAGDRRVAVIFKDITSRKRAEAELRESEVLFRQMMDALPTAVYTTDADGLVTYFNPAAVEFSGRTPELGSDHWCVTWKLYHPDGTPMPHDECPMAISLKEGRAIHGMEAIAERPDGTRRWFEPYPSPLRDARGVLTGGINMLVDITERKQMEEELRESEERFRGLFHSAPVAVFVCDRAGVVQAYNSYAAELWGREPVCGDPKELNCGSMLLRHPNGDLLPHAESPIVDVLRTGEPHHGAELIIERPDGSQVSVLVNFAPLTDASGEVTGAITSFIDITERKQIEEELREAARLKDDLLGLVAHEFRTPLTTITGNIDILVRRFNELPPEMRDQALHEIQRGSDRLRRLIQNMLVVARGERGKDEELEPLLLQRTLEGIVVSEQERDPSRSITLSVSPGFPPVVASAGYLEQVVENLITNARKYSHIATPIEISAVADDGTAVVRVRDEGETLSAEKVERFFEPFYRSDDVPRQAGGAGLGLAVCATLVERMEGKIWARPNPGGGLEVLFSLPFAHLDSDE